MTERRGSFDREEAHSKLYERMHSDRPLEDRLRAALDVGVAYLGVDLGFITEIDLETDDWEIVISTDPPDRPNPTGLTEDLTNTFCNRTIRHEEIFSFADVADVGLEAHPTAVTYGLRCYHGAPIFVDGSPYGTVCFSAQEARSDPFSEAEESFIHLLAHMAGYEIEQQRYERQLAARERELTERQEISRAVIDASFDFVFRIDTRGRFTYASPSVGEFLGYSTDELDGRSITTLYPDEETADRIWTLFEAVLSGESIDERYVPLVTKPGTVVYVDIRATPIYDGDVPSEKRSPDDIVAVQGMARDATDRKRREGLISVIHRVLRHNLRNDMSIVRGYAEILEDELASESDSAELARKIGATADRLVDLSETAQTLETNLDAPAELQRLDVVSIVDRAASQLEDRYPSASIAVSAPDRALAETAPRLETALWELLDNAAKHTGASPSIDVDVSITDDEVVIRVSDDGPGLPTIERSVLTSGEEKPLVHGQGLGLWVVYWIVTGLSGTLEVSAGGADDGTTVCVRLPRAS